MRLWKIIHQTVKDEETGRPLQWSNEQGWVDIGDLFTNEERKTGDLPMEGVWLPIQFR
jgi:hypothetical protein